MRLSSRRTDAMARGAWQRQDPRRNPPHRPPPVARPAGRSSLTVTTGGGREKARVEPLAPGERLGEQFHRFCAPAAQYAPQWGCRNYTNLRYRRRGRLAAL